MRKRKTTLTVLPKTSRPKRIPKPQVESSASDPLSRKGVKARIGINVPGVKVN